MALTRIVVFEDDPFLRSLLLETLEMEGYPTAPAHTFDAALALASEQDGQLVLADFWGSSHSELSAAEAEEIATLQSRARVLLVTGRTWARATTAQSLGLYAILPKPFNLEELLILLRQLQEE